MIQFTNNDKFKIIELLNIINGSHKKIKTKVCLIYINAFMLH